MNETPMESLMRPVYVPPDLPPRALQLLELVRPEVGDPFAQVSLPEIPANRPKEN